MQKNTTQRRKLVVLLGLTAAFTLLMALTAAAAEVRQTGFMVTNMGLIRPMSVPA